MVAILSWPRYVQVLQFVMLLFALRHMSSFYTADWDFYLAFNLESFHKGTIYISDMYMSSALPGF